MSLAFANLRASAASLLNILNASEPPRMAVVLSSNVFAHSKHVVQKYTRRYIFERASALFSAVFLYLLLIFAKGFLPHTAVTGYERI